MMAGTIRIGGVDFDVHSPGLPIPESYRAFLESWLSPEPYVTVHTSGSTGQPKSVQLPKAAMIASARMTGTRFGLKAGDRALVCLPARYIAGKMMLVRGLVLGLDLHFTEPDSAPLAATGDTDFAFAAMVPLQVQHSLARHKARFERIQTVIVGGAPVSHRLEADIRTCRNRVFETYGMTETITHVAVRDLKIGGPFEALEGVAFSTDARGCLVVHAPHLHEGPVATNDLVALDGSRFRWLGRIDHIINSGGVKVVPEEVERALAPHLSGRFFVAGLPDAVLGETVALLTEGPAPDLAALASKVHLPKHHFPRKAVGNVHFVETETGKVMRKETVRQLAN